MSFPRYPKYKASGVEWLGEVPEHWEVRQLRHCVERMASGGTPESGRSEYWCSDPGEGGCAWVAIGDMTRCSSIKETDRRLTAEGVASKQLEVFPVGTLLYSMYASLGKVATLAIPAAVNQAILAVVPASRVVMTDFLRHWLRNLEPSLGFVASSNTQENLNAAKVRGFPVVLPPLAEQRAIAAFLDRETKKIDELVAEQERLIELLKEKRQAVISHAVTKGLDPAAPMKPSGVEWLGDVPAHWEVQRLGNFLREPPCYGVLVPDFDPVGVPMLRIQDMNGGKVDPSVLTTISKSLSDQYNRTIVAEGDLVLSVVGTIGVSMVIDASLTGVNLSRAVARLQLASRLRPQFCRWCFMGLAFMRFTDLICVGTAQRVLNMSDVRAMRLAVPPLQEQLAIAAFLDRETEKIETLTTQSESAISLLTERRSALISAAVTGQIDVRNAVPGANPTEAA